ncbi:ParA family protein [Moraxella atlantae]|uniref:Partitioning protein n=1 Tax=Faucicola atlantae TaxID=34059 RepID=A0A1B8QGE4_9GAMM|nr:ParA family protein [Moraxella atlantae]OBX81078.1 partitioning protein [Moraxella atlantae]OPH35395.1 partitioning protein [Moraxella atlantae]STZ01740.1 Sporulation initiation inhibitor protein soj [Moraxella atlantae]
MKQKNTRIITIANHKGGCGKTATVVHLAAELAQLELSVLVIDLDPQGNASTHIGKKHPSEIEVTIKDLLLGGYTKLVEAIQEDTCIKGVHLISSSLSLTTEEDKIKDNEPRPMEVLGRIIRPLVGVYDVILIDTPPSLRTLTGNALSCATDYIIPVFSGSQYGMYGVLDLQAYIEKIKYINPELNLLGALLIRHDERQLMCRAIKEAAKEQIGKVIPIEISSSNNIDKAAALKVSVREVDPTARIARKFRQLAMWTAKETGLKPELTLNFTADEDNND